MYIENETKILRLGIQNVTSLLTMKRVDEANLSGLFKLGIGSKKYIRYYVKKKYRVFFVRNPII